MARVVRGLGVAQAFRSGGQTALHFSEQVTLREAFVVEPEVIHRVAGAALLGGVMVLFGAGYAIFHALAGLTGSRRMVGVSILCYLLLCCCAVGFAALLRLADWWLALMGLLLIGYFVAPRFIWKLSLAVHGETQPNASKPLPSSTKNMEESRHE